MNFKGYEDEYVNSYKAVVNTPEIFIFKPINYVIIDKIVSSESEEAGRAVEALDLINNTIKKSATNIKDYYEYNIFPLEGVWSLINEEISFNDHNNIVGKFMTKQPLFINDKEWFNNLKTEILKNNTDPSIKNYLEQAKLEEIDEGKVVQILHIGDYKNEPKTFQIITDFMQKNLSRKDNFHREIYLKDIRTTSRKNFETILRIQVI